MNEQTLNIFYRKKYLIRSFMLYLFSLSIWVGIYFIFVFQLILNKHPNVGEITHIVLSIILTFVFVIWTAKFLRVLVVCLSEYKSAPKIAYSLNEEGVRGFRTGWFISWGKIYQAVSIVENEGYHLQKTNGSGHLMNSWGIDPKEMRQAKTFIRQKLPKNKTKRLK